VPPNALLAMPVFPMAALMLASLGPLLSLDVQQL